MSKLESQAQRKAIEARAVELLIQCDDPDATAEERKELDDWLAADPRHAVAYVRALQLWKRSDRLQELRLPKEVQGSDAAGIAPKLRRPTRRFWRSRLVTALAAGLLCGAIITALWPASQSDWTGYTTQLGTQRRISLSDGSVVTLNTDSVLRVRMSASRRELVLERGEALFKVSHDAKRPFIVHAGSKQFRAVGTEFSVRVQETRRFLGGQDRVELLVKEGSVAIDSPDGSAEQPVSGMTASAPVITAGEKVTVRAKRVQIERLAQEDVSRKLSWVDGRLWFERETVSNVSAEFNRYNQRQIVIADPAVGDLRIGGGFEATDVESFLAALERTLNVRVDRSDPNVYRLYAPEPPTGLNLPMDAVVEPSA